MTKRNSHQRLPPAASRSTAASRELTEHQPAEVTPPRSRTKRQRADQRPPGLPFQWAHLERAAVLAELATSLAQQVNQPLYCILNYANACRNVLAQDPPRLDELRDWSLEIANAATRAGDGLRRILARTHHSPPQRRKIDLGEVVEDAIALIAAELHRLHIRARWTPGDTCLTALAERIEVQRLLVHLLQNACEALTDTAGARRIVVRAAVTGEFFEISVADNGPGLAEAVVATLFEPFVTTKPAGLGLGLSISKTIVEAHGGRIWGDANAAGGATFHFTLPRG